MRTDQRFLQTGVSFLLFALTLQADAATRPGKAAGAQPLALGAVAANDPAKRPRLAGTGASGSSVLRAQVLLDRAHFSPGEIDGRFGGNTRRAVAAFNEVRGIEAGDRVEAKTWAELNRDTAPVVVPYVLAPGDVAGPFEILPAGIPERARLAALGFESPIEGLGERFHSSARLLLALNPGVVFDREGIEILVPNVERAPLAEAAGLSVRVSEKDHSVVALASDGSVRARYPATVGSEHDPLPVGEWKINGVGWNPTFLYNPALFWDSEPGDEKARLPAGPNNPVGVVWIDLSKPHYGIHGTPEPSTIGGTTSHGCIRLTNWDALELSHLVSPGTPALLVK
ncbi:MAG: murein L,D-transpeptidase [Holophagales bacterium]|nr:murein L,D-transpeptidase [Holophagales bacterium]